MKLAIVGSTCLEDSEKEVKKIIRTTIKRLCADTIISGGAVGVDTFAEEVADELGLEKIIFKPKQKSWAYFKKRNLLIAKECDTLLRIVSKRSTTYGSGWTRDRAKEMGKLTYESILP